MVRFKFHFNLPRVLAEHKIVSYSNYHCPIVLMCVDIVKIIKKKKAFKLVHTIL